MRNDFRNFLILSFFLWSGVHYGQSSTTPPNLIPPSPEAASLFKFVETPVNLNSGLANIGVPIYTIKTKGVDIPIALSYHSRGIKVGEVASRVGLGWTLNYGGMVSRQVRGKNDDGDAYGYLKDDIYDDFFTNESTRNSAFQRETNGNLDYYPDKFFFNFPGHSGKFIFDQVSKEPWQQKYSDIEIIPLRSSTSSVIRGFKIIDEKGNKYYFGALSSSTSLGNVKGDKESSNPWWVKNNGVSGQMTAGATGDGFSGWYLIRIETYYNEIITFSYATETAHYIRKSYDENLTGSGSGSAISYYSVLSNAQHRISEINFPGGRVIFNEETAYEREDLPGTHALKNIEIRNSNNEQVKKFDFAYNFITSATNANYSSHLASRDPSSHKRMFLHSVTETAGSLSKPPYEFEYSSIKLPNRFSTSQDNWGYYNGENNGPLLPFYDYGSYSMDRRVDSTKNGAGLLKKVIYPTGGSATYEYEQNIAVKPTFLDQTVSPGNNPEVQKTAFLGHLMTTKFDSSIGAFKTPVSISENKSSSVYSTVQFTYQDPLNGPCEDFDSTAECGFLMILDGGPGSTYSIPYGNNINLAGIPAGDYEFRVYPPNGDPSIYFTAQLSWYEEEPVEDNQGNALMLASGKRIKKIIYSDGQSVVKTKEYEYKNPDGSNSGKIFGYPNFYAMSDVLSPYDIAVKYGCKPGGPFTSLQGNEVAYGYVTEYEGTKGANIGKTEYEFTNVIDGGTFYKFPYTLPIDNQWLRGKPLHTKFFKADGSGYDLIKEVENSYIYADDETRIDQPFLLSFDPFIHVDSSSTKTENSKYYHMPLAMFTPDDEQQDGHAFKVYYQMGGTADLYSTVERDYLKNENGSQTVVKSTYYGYNYPKHYQQDYIEETLDGKTNQTFLTYSSEVGSTNEFGDISALKQANRVALLERETLVKDGSATVARSVERTLYEYQLGSNLTLPSKIETAKLGDAFSERLVYHKYDADGNPVEVSQSNGPHTVYIWGYNGNYPVAKIQNASYAAVESALGGGGFDLGNGGLSQSQKNALRALSNSLVTTYTYKPLVGMLSETDPTGNIMTYEYDDLGRLETLRNRDGKIIKHINYHFKNN